MSYRTDLLEKYQVRKTKKQKTEFIDYATGYAAKCGYSARVEGNGKSVRNIVIGDVEGASVVYTAHYDTQAVMLLPNFITPKNIFIYILYQLLLVAMLLVLPITAAILLRELVPEMADFAVVLFLLLYYAEFGIMMFGPANRHTANDNTSGVATVLGIMEKMQVRTDVAFILFDCEELGLIGSKHFAKKHKDIMKERLLVNFDCVSDGKNMMFVCKKGAARRIEQIKAAFLPSGEINCLYETRWVIYPSDQSSFEVGVGVAAFHRTRRGLYYANRIHTPRDTVFDEGNIDYLVDGAVRLADALSTACCSREPVGEKEESTRPV